MASIGYIPQGITGWKLLIDRLLEGVEPEVEPEVEQWYSLIGSRVGWRHLLMTPFWFRTCWHTEQAVREIQEQSNYTFPDWTFYVVVVEIREVDNEVAEGVVIASGVVLEVYLDARGYNPAIPSLVGMRG